MRSMAGKGRGRGAAAHGSRDRLHHTLDIGEHIVVPEPQHAIAALVQIRCSPHIASDATCFVVLSAIEFNHKAGAMAGEVCEVRTDSCLAAKVRAVHGEMTQMLPQHALRRRRLVTHHTRARHASVTFSLIWSLPQSPPTPDPSPPLALLAWGGETRGTTRDSLTRSSTRLDFSVACGRHACLKHVGLSSPLPPCHTWRGGVGAGGRVILIPPSRCGGWCPRRGGHPRPKTWRTPRQVGSSAPAQRWSAARRTADLRLPCQWQPLALI